MAGGSALAGCPSRRRCGPGAGYRRRRRRPAPTPGGRRRGSCRCRPCLEATPGTRAPAGDPGAGRPRGRAGGRTAAGRRTGPGSGAAAGLAGDGDCRADGRRCRGCPRRRRPGASGAASARGVLAGGGRHGRRPGRRRSAASRRRARSSEDVRVDLEGQLAGPRATARMLALLPLVGIGFGMMLGSDPLSWLLGTTPGRLCLPGGTRCSPRPEPSGPDASRPGSSGCCDPRVRRADRGRRLAHGHAVARPTARATADGRCGSAAALEARWHARPARCPGRRLRRVGRRGRSDGPRCWVSDAWSRSPGPRVGWNRGRRVRGARSSNGRLRCWPTW